MDHQDWEPVKFENKKKPKVPTSRPPTDKLDNYTGEGAPNFSVGYLIDGIDFSGIGMAGMLFDVQQIEVFRGPQSSIYGPNAMAGLINISTTD